MVIISTRPKLILTAILLTDEQKKFMRDHVYNLSAWVRSKIDSEIEVWRRD